MQSNETLPRWDLTPIFPSLDSSEFGSEFNSVLEKIAELKANFDQFGIRRRDTKSVDSEFVAQFEAILNDWNALLQRLATLNSYIGCFVTTDAKNERAQSLESQLETQTVVLGQLQTRLIAWVGSCEIEKLLESSQIARDHEFWVRRAAIWEKHQMSEAEENLASALRPMGYGGWAKLHGTLSSLLTAKIEIAGEIQTLPMSALRGLATNSDRNVRKSAFEAELKAWETVSPSLAAAMNGIKGFARETRSRRGFAGDVAPTLLANAIDAPTLEAMQSACIEAFPDFRRYLKAKARAFGIEKLAWFDLVAPVGADEKKWDWPETENFIETQFGRYSPALATFARRSFEENWTDAPAQRGKVGGAYCTGTRPGESRVLMNFDGSFTGVSTLAHELGHTYHNWCLRNRTPIQDAIPMTLAETASIFCETLVFEGAVKKADRNQKIALLDNALSRNLMVVVDIHSRFLFEKSVFERRGERELTENELGDLMTQAQLQTYGDDVSPLHPLMWAVKGHYYGANFYNYPYTFGLLFGLGLYARYEENPDQFRQKYDDFLSRCGMADARTLAQDFGFDVSQKAFWQSSLQLIKRQIDEFESLV